jgi:uncharacterized C2H2 Zn-finger protein
MIESVCDMSKSSLGNTLDQNLNIWFTTTTTTNNDLSREKQTSTPTSDKERVKFDFDAIKYPSDKKRDKKQKPMSNETWLKCKKCCKQIRSKAYDKHIEACSSKTDINDLVSKTCAQCGLVFKVKSDLDKHTCKKLLEVSIKSEKRTKMFECKVCHKVYREKSKFYTHMKKHDKHVIKCIECPMMFEDQKSFESHFKVHSRKLKIKKEPLDKTSKDSIADTKQLHGCTICNKQFMFESSLKRHLKLENCKEPI